MAMSAVPVAMSLQVAYSVLPSMIYDNKKGEGISDFTICPPALSSIIQEQFGGIWIDTATADIWFRDGNH